MSEHEKIGAAELKAKGKQKQTLLDKKKINH